MSDLTTGTRVRVARPSRDLQAARRFYVDGLGLSVLYDNDGDDPFTAIVILGLPGAAWHLELTRPHDHPPTPSPTHEDLLVLYLGSPPDPRLLERLTTHGATVVDPPNPYWARWGVTVQDPDGYRLVLCEREWTS